MEGGILTALSVISTVCAIVFGYVAFVRNRDQDKTKEAKSDATILTELGYNTDRAARVPLSASRLSAAGLPADTKIPHEGFTPSRGFFCWLQI